MMRRVGRRRRAPSGRRELVIGEYAKYDLARAERTGVPEVILAEGKSVEHLVGILRALAREGRGALVSRPTPAQRRRLRQEVTRGLAIVELASGRLLRLNGPLVDPPPTGRVALLAAGTADVPVAEEARALLESSGVSTVVAYDIGVAGIHRLTRALARLERKRPRVYLVFAGREGALPTIVAGLVHGPVVGIPTSVGYGRGGRGEAALLAMLQSCAPVAVMNIDAAVPAALFALQLLGRDFPRQG